LHEHEVLNLRKDGSPIYFELHETLIPLPDGRQGILVVANDISERKHSEELMQESRRQLEIFAEHLQEAREEERISLARELHDNLGQNLTALKIDISRILKKLQDAPSHRHSEQINAQGQNMLQLIDLTIDMVRKISSDLRPAVLDELGIISAIEWQIHEFTKLSGIPCEMDIDVKKVIIPPECSVGVFRIFQEMLTNIIRHAKASKVIIRLKKKYSSIILEVEDNGLGINEDKVNDHKSLGLIGMRERAMLFGGNVSIGKNGKGTRVILTIPSKKQLYD
jgi:signal transduction histidine kinase